MNPGEAWLAAFDATTPDMRAKIAATLRVDAPDAAQLAYILRPFVPLHHDDKWWLAAILDPCPVNFPEALAWTPDTDVVLIDMANGAMRTFSDEPGCFVLPADAGADGEIRLYVNGILFARDWAAARASWIDAIARDVVPGSRAEPSGQPGAALCGDLDRVVDFETLKSSRRVVVDDPRVVRDLTRALLRSARLPAVEAMPPRLRAVA